MYTYIYVYMVSLFDINQPGMQRVESHGEWSVGAEVIASLVNTTPGRVKKKTGSQAKAEYILPWKWYCQPGKMYINNLYGFV